MTTRSDQQDNMDAASTDADGGRLPYERPLVTRVDLALEETMSKGCKLESDFGCVIGVTAFDAGS